MTLWDWGQLGGGKASCCLPLHCPDTLTPDTHCTASLSEVICPTPVNFDSRSKIHGEPGGKYTRLLASELPPVFMAFVCDSTGGGGGGGIAFLSHGSHRGLRMVLYSARSLRVLVGCATTTTSTCFLERRPFQQNRSCYHLAGKGDHRSVADDQLCMQAVPRSISGISSFKDARRKAVEACSFSL